MIKEDAKEMGGAKAVLQALRFSTDNPEIETFLRAYDALPAGDRDRLPWEAIALSADINVSHLLGAIHVAVQRYSASRVKFVISMGHPLIAQSRIKYGQLAGGEKDRSAVDMMTGAMPSPKGPTFNLNNIFGGKQAAAGNDDDNGDDDNVVDGEFSVDDDLDALFPPAKIMQDKLTPIRQKLLE